VWALRAQTDKRQYARQMLQLLQHTPNLAQQAEAGTGLEHAAAAWVADDFTLNQIVQVIVG
jgi:tRNA uridine 5-carboxymethylaminomethyl modification enzyme